VVSVSGLIPKCVNMVRELSIDCLSGMKVWWHKLNDEKAEMEKQVEVVKTENLQYRKEIEILDIKHGATKKNYHTMLVCSWVMFALCFFFRYAAQNQQGSTINHLRLP